MLIELQIQELLQQPLQQIPHPVIVLLASLQCFQVFPWNAGTIVLKSGLQGIIAVRHQNLLSSSTVEGALLVSQSIKVTNLHKKSYTTVWLLDCR